MNKVFVYGTLKKGNSIRGLDQFAGAEFVGSATTTEGCFDMVSLGAFPAVLLNGDQNISGEVWQVDEHVFEMLDHIEGYPTFYNRKLVGTTHGLAWMYYLNRDSDTDNTVDYNDISMENDVLEWTQ